MTPSELRVAWEKTTEDLSWLASTGSIASQEDAAFIALAHREWPRLVGAVEEVERLGKLMGKIGNVLSRPKTAPSDAAHDLGEISELLRQHAVALATPSEPEKPC